MELGKVQAYAESDLLMSEIAARFGQHQVTRRAEIYVATHALTLERVLENLQISRATWYRRLDALREWEAEMQPPCWHGNAPAPSDDGGSL